ncbi:MAG: hypothetical protein DRP38_01285 [Thermotogae bacterium]|nr:MAG: hypothetical protein DRP38_01285 [Thermotogota bacterium]
MDPIQEIVEACREDPRIRKIVEEIAAMEDDEREIFRKKVKSYFLSRTSSEDVEAYKFFKLILNESILKQVLDRLSDLR